MSKAARYTGAMGHNKDDNSDHRTTSRDSKLFTAL